MVWRWCRRRHRNKSRKWIKEKYFQRDDHRHWVFTGTLRDQKGQGWPIQLMEAAKVRIIRYVKIRSDVNPYDPKWELYPEHGWVGNCPKRWQGAVGSSTYRKEQ